jgi:hypothetical protein
LLNWFDSGTGKKFTNRFTNHRIVNFGSGTITTNIVGFAAMHHPRLRTTTSANKQSNKTQNNQCS